MSEELKKEPTQGAPESAAPVVPAPASEAKPEMSADMRALVAAEVAKVRDEYEKKHIPAIKSERDRYKAQLAQRATAAQQQAQALMQAGKPDEAAQILSYENAALVQGSQAEQQEAAMQAWLASVPTAFGIAPEDPAVAEAARKTNPWASPDGAWNYQTEIGRVAQQRERERADKAEKELASVRESLPSLIKGEMIKAFNERYGEPDLSAPQGGGEKKDDLMKLPPTRRITAILAKEAEHKD
jgi:hypothetical protein